MKKIYFSLFLLFVPFLSMAADDGCSPSLLLYTIDRRCYVTDEQKKKSPYNAVVALIDNEGDAYCTGTVMKHSSTGKLYVRTAKHCVIDSFDNIEKQLNIRAVSNRTYTADFVEAGDFTTVGGEKNLTGDWAFYKINGKYDDGSVSRTHNTGASFFNLNKVNYEARLVGHGCLKIMSDAEIHNFKQAYIEYLENVFPEYDQSIENVKNAGFVEGGVDLDNAMVINFLEDNSILNRNDCNRLKESVCGFTSSGERIACQSWGGNSGGPVFDKENRLMATLTRGKYIIGGPNHADGYVMSEECSINELRGTKSLLDCIQLPRDYDFMDDF